MLELHCHTRCSDGYLSSAELLSQAARLGVKVLAVTDHDTMAAYDELWDIAKYFRIQLIPGIEISSEHSQSGMKVHILGYYPDWSHPLLRQVCQAMIERRETATRTMLSRVAKLGYRIGPDDVDPLCRFSTNLYKVHIMHALFQGGYSSSITNPGLYKELFSAGGKAYVPIDYVPVEDAVRSVREAGGLAVLAHPGVFKNQRLLTYLLELGIQGIEAYHPCNSPEDTAWCLQKAQKYGLIVTGGSDCHGLYGDFPDLLGSRSPGNETLRFLRRKAG